MTQKTIKLNYRSAERFSRDYAQIKKGKIFLRSTTPLSAGARLNLEFNLSGINQPFMADGRVALSIDRQAADRFKKPQGMLVVIMGGFKDILQDLDIILCENEEYRRVLGLPHKKTVTQDTPAISPDKHRIQPSVQKAREVSIPIIPLEAKRLYKDAATADNARASQAKEIQVKFIGAKVSKEKKPDPTEPE